MPTNRNECFHLLTHSIFDRVNKEIQNMNNTYNYKARSQPGLTGSTFITPVVPLRDRSDGNWMEIPDNSIISIQGCAEVLVTYYWHATQGTLGTAIRAVLKYIGALLTKLQQRMITWKEWRKKQSSILVLRSRILTLLKWLYSPTPSLDLPSGVLTEAIKNRRWAVFRRKAED